MRIHYLASINVPERNASGLQITQTANAMAQYVDGIEVVLLRYVGDSQDVVDYYGLKNVSARKASGLSIFKNAEKYTLRRLEVFLNLIFVRLTLRKPAYIYTREPYTGVFFKDFFLEVHVIAPNVGIINSIAYKRAKKIICISNGLRTRLIEIGVPPEKILVAADAVNLDLYRELLTKGAAREQLGISRDKKILVYTGSLFSDRGEDALLSFISSLPENTSLFLVGRIQEDLLHKIEGKPNVTCVGVRPHSEIPVWQQAADALILFNSEKVQTFRDFTSPMKLFEYMAANRPIVAPDLPSIREILDDSCAVLVESDNADAYRLGVEKVLNNEALSAELASRARERARQYTWEKRAEKIITFLKRQ
jgi:glycosyltransferase involved in cell wall biosynthesis